MKENLLKAIANSRNYTLRTAELMPLETYNTKLTDQNWNFGELLSHVAYSIGWWTDNYVLVKETGWNPPTPNVDKLTIIVKLKEAFDQFEQKIQEISLNPQSLHGAYATLDHVTHHRGQCVLFLRQQGIEPPEYIY
ncbi:MAG TPA: DinB family protein [Pseudosphingobacterium sp.]|nr:DinB family protein [Pseudosphingobacterium sp.]